MAGTVPDFATALTFYGAEQAAIGLFCCGDDNLFHGDRYKWSVRFTVINLTNKEALYNFLGRSTAAPFAFVLCTNCWPQLALTTTCAEANTSPQQNLPSG